MNASRPHKLALLIVIPLLLVGILACDLGGAAAKPEVTVMGPPSGIDVWEGEDVEVALTATDAKGVTRVELLVDGELHRTDASPDPAGAKSWTLVQTWLAEDPGPHTLTVVAYNVDDVASDPWAIAVRVTEGPPAPGTTPTATSAAPPPPEATATATTEAPPAATDTATATPTDTPMPTQPDLNITEVTLDPASPEQGQEVTVRVSVYNGGNAPAGAQRVIWRSAGPTVGCEWDVDPLVAHGGQVLQCPYTYGGWNHAYVTTAVADVDNEVVESNEGNNSLELVVDVRPAAAAAPDLYITELTLDPVSPLQGEEVTVRVSVYNGGNAPAGAQMVIWRSAGPTVGCQWMVGPLPARGGRVKTCPYTYGGWNHAYVTTAVADFDGDVDESDEDNNSYELVVDVRPS